MLFGFTLSGNAKARWLDITKKANEAAAELGSMVYLDQVITDFIAEMRTRVTRNWRMCVTCASRSIK